MKGIFLSSLLFLLSGICQADALVVVVNKDNPVDALSKTQVIDIFMGRYITFPDGNPVKPFDLGAELDVKRKFYQRLVNKDLAKINSYWARLLFSGRASPPESVDSMKLLLARVSDTKGALAYLPEASVDESVKVVYRLE